MPIRSQMTSIMGQIEAVHLELFALEFVKIAEYDFVYTLSSTNMNQSAPNLVKLYEFHYGSNQTRTVQVICH